MEYAREASVSVVRQRVCVGMVMRISELSYRCCGTSDQLIDRH